MLDDEGILPASHHQQVLQHDPRAGILDHPNRFMTARNLALQRFVAFAPGRRFLHVETNLIVACHRQDICAILLEGGGFGSFAALLHRGVRQCRADRQHQGEKGRADQRGGSVSADIHDAVLHQNVKLADTLKLRPGRVYASVTLLAADSPRTSDQ